MEQDDAYPLPGLSSVISRQAENWRKLITLTISFLCLPWDVLPVTGSSPEIILLLGFCQRIVLEKTKSVGLFLLD